MFCSKLKTFNFKSTKPNLPSPYDEILTLRKNNKSDSSSSSSSVNIDKLKHRLKLVNDISNLNNKISYPNNNNSSKLINASPLTSSLFRNQQQFNSKTLLQKRQNN